MKKSVNIISALLIVTLFSACHRGHRGTTIVISSPGEYTRIRYSGEVSFTEDSTAIKSISPFGYISYQKNNASFLAESDEKGMLTIMMINEDSSTVNLDEGSKKFIAEGVKVMMEQGVRLSYVHH